MCRAKQEFIKKNATQKVEPIVSLVTQQITSLKKDLKRNENPPKNLDECVIKTGRKTRKKTKHHPNLVPAVVDEPKPDSKVQVIEKTEN
ncbi:hypothetical protein ACTXT7_001611 [Hymenolepis weldensis]